MLKKLIKAGLSKNEAGVYLALLELGSASVTEIAKTAKVARTNAYHLLDALLSYGLVTTRQHKTKKVYSVEKPDKLLTLMKSRLNEAEHRYKDLENFMPELNSVYHNPDKKLKVRYYEGGEGIVSAYEDTLTARGKLLAYASVEHQHSFCPGYFPTYYERRTKRGIFVDCILAETKESLRIKSLDSSHIRKTFIVPEKFHISPEINIYDNKVAILSLKEKFGVIIESQQVADALKKLFTLAYERAEVYDEKIMKRLNKKKK